MTWNTDFDSAPADKRILVWADDWYIEGEAEGKGERGAFVAEWDGEYWARTDVPYCSYFSKNPRAWTLIPDFDA